MSSSGRALTRALMAMIALGALAAGCSSDASDTDAAAPEPAAEGAVGPLRFTAEDDAAASVTVTPAGGGSATATGSDGTTFDLEVPPGAVLEDTELRIVPLTDITGMAGDGPVVAARLEPDGQQFAVPVTLTVRPGTEIPREDQLLFVADHDGGAVQPALVDPRNADPSLYLLHFSLAGEAGVNDSILDDAFGVAAADAAADLGRQIAVELARATRGDNTDGAIERVVELYDELDRTIYAPALEQLGKQPTRCSSALRTVSTIVGTLRDRQTLGIPADNVDLLTPLRAAYADCEREAIRRCKQRRDPAPLMQFWLSDTRNLSLLGVGGPVDFDALSERAKVICVPRRYTASGGGNGVSITGTVPDLTRPFLLSGSGEGFAIQLSYTPGDADGRRGTMTYEGSGSGVALSGSSTYTITGEEGGPLTLTQVGDGCTSGPSTDCASGTEVVVLTPIP